MAVNTEMLAKAAQNEEFMSKIRTAETVEELQSICAEYGADYSIEEIREIAENSEGDAELDENALDDVSGGSVAYDIGRTINKFFSFCSWLGRGGLFGKA